VYMEHVGIVTPPVADRVGLTARAHTRSEDSRWRYT
jgi:hypothetical protein